MDFGGLTPFHRLYYDAMRALETEASILRNSGRFNVPSLDSQSLNGREDAEGEQQSQLEQQEQQEQPQSEEAETPRALEHQSTRVRPSLRGTCRSCLSLPIINPMTRCLCCVVLHVVALQSLRSKSSRLSNRVSKSMKFDGGELFMANSGSFKFDNIYADSEDEVRNRLLPVTQPAVTLSPCDRCARIN